MKISKIEIKNFQQFKDITIDLTYPKGHDKEGLPLDKVCFIGQSGTGKTTILELLVQGYFPMNLYKDFGIIRKNLGENSVCAVGLVDKEGKHQIVNYGNNQNLSSTKLSDFDKAKQGLYYFPYFDKKFDDFEANLKEHGDFEGILKSLSDDTETEEGRKFFHRFDSEGLVYTWLELRYNIEQYKENEIDFRVQLTKQAEREEINIKEKLEEWRKSNINPLKDLAENCLDRILNQFQLELKTDIDSVSELNSIQIRSKIDGSLIPFSGLSTGTKDFIFTALPLYGFNLDNSLVLIDQPEASLYPDIQRQIIDTYTSFGDNSQFFFATHSPIIASNFEPWEIVELEFGKNGYVKRKLYYEGENHVDNYTINPQYLRWDAILNKVFGMTDDGNTPHRLPKLVELATLESQLKAMNGSPNKKEKWKEYQRLATLLDWETD